MPISVWILLFGLSPASALADSPSPVDLGASASNDLHAIYLGAHDGDTFKVKLVGNFPSVLANISVRVKGIDTAEITSKLACERNLANMAKTELSALFSKNEVVTLRNCEKDKYFRLLCDVTTAKAQDVSREMLAHGLAHAYQGKTKAPFVCAPR